MKFARESGLARCLAVGSLSHGHRKHGWSRWIVCASLAGLLGGGHSHAQPLAIQGIQFQGGNVAVDVNSVRDLYYVLDRLDLGTGNAVGALDVQLGNLGSGRLVDANPPSTFSFYRARGFSSEHPGDLDGDGIDDVYELGQPGLNPLNPADAGNQIAFDGATATELEAYLNNYEIGRGMHDVTGLAAGGGMQGYADGDQVSTGIHDRQWARAFIVRDRRPPNRRVVYVVVDNGQLTQSITQGVHDKIKDDPELNGFYSYENIVLSATHTHGSAGGHSHFAILHASIGGYSWRTYDALVHGTYMAIKKAHRDLKPGSIQRNRGDLLNANENRAPNAITRNVEFTHPQLVNPFATDNRDVEMMLFRFEQQGVGPVAMFNWFPVHGVSVSKENTLLTGDNKGNAAYLFEKAKAAVYPGMPGYDSNTSTFVAGFANSNPGDLTANRRTLEAPWPDHGVDDYGRATTIGGRQYAKALELFAGTTGKLAKVTGSIDYRHRYVDFSAVTVDPPSLYPYNVAGVGFPAYRTQAAQPWRTCHGGYGVEFGKGTLDGAGELDDFLANLLILFPNVTIFDPEIVACQAPKDMLIRTTGPDVGLGPHWLPISILKVGDVVILAVPAEFTVMAASRLRKTVEDVFAAQGVRVRAVLSGLSNSYAGYVTTYEEYYYEALIQGVPNQGYEAASTQFGPFTLAAYQTQFAEMAESMANGTSPPADAITVAMPAQVRPDVPFVSPLDKGHFVDEVPIVAATYHEAAGCPSGQFHDLGTGDCWSCPTGYNRTVFAVTASNACEKPAFSQFSSATQHGAAGCAAGQFFDLGTGDCWSCPTGYNRTVFAVTAPNACEKPAFSEFTAAQSQTATGGTDCPSGYVYDFTLGRCYKCPTGYGKVVTRSWADPAACEKTDELSTAAQNQAGSGILGTDCPSGYVYDFSLARCYKCPDTYSKHVGRAWNAGNACVKYATTTAAAQNQTATGGTDCPSGYVYDFTLGFCYRCPTGYNKVVVVAWNNAQACEKVNPAVFSSATNRGDGGCPAGQFLDLGLGTCWSCPSGYNRTAFAVTGNTACEKVNPAVFASATRYGKFACEHRNPLWFLDVGLNQCWSCPAGFDRNLNPVGGGSACTLASFGALRTGPSASYPTLAGVEVSFWAGHPGNVFGTYDDDLTNAVGTFLEVQRKIGAGQWQTVATDADWNTTFEWREAQQFGAATIKWIIPGGTTPGTYRILHRGYWGELFDVTPYEATSPEFQVTP